MEKSTQRNKKETKLKTIQESVYDLRIVVFSRISYHFFPSFAITYIGWAPVVWCQCNSYALKL